MVINRGAPTIPEAILTIFPFLNCMLCVVIEKHIQSK